MRGFCLFLSWFAWTLASQVYAQSGGPANCGWGTYWNTDSAKCVLINPPFLGLDQQYQTLNPCYFDLDLSGSVGAYDLLNVLSVYDQETDCTWDNGYDDSYSCANPTMHQGYAYETVVIGGQCWFAENVRYLPLVGSPSGNVGNAMAVVCGYYGDSVAEAQQDQSYQSYGAQYNFEAIETWDLCPAGWRVPSDTDWMVLEAEIGLSEIELVAADDFRGSSVGASEALKSTTGWSLAGNNSTGFTALPGGVSIGSNDLCFLEGEVEGWAVFGSSTYAPDPSSPVGEGMVLRLLTDVEGFGISRFAGGAMNLYYVSVRCVQDAE